MSSKTFHCKACNERPVYTCVSFDAANNFGDFRQCNLCKDITPMKRRMTAKKRDRVARFNWLMAQIEDEERSAA